MTKSKTHSLAVALAFAGIAAVPRLDAQQVTNVAPAPVGAQGATVGAGPNGATLRCRDGSYPVANAPESACESKGGVAVRFPLRRTAPSPALMQAAPSAPPRIRAASDSLVIPDGFVSYEQRQAARTTVQAPPANATLLCENGTYIVSDTVAARCQPHGGLRLRLEAAARRP